MWGPRTVGPGPPRSSRYNLRSRAGHSMTGPCAAPCTVVEWRAGRGTEAKRRSRRVVSRRPASPARARHERHPSPSPRLRGAEPAPLPAVEGKIVAPPSTRRGRVAARMRGRDEGEGHAPSCPQPAHVHPVNCVHPPRTNPVARRTRQGASLQKPLSRVSSSARPGPFFRVVRGFRGDLPPQNSSSVGISGRSASVSRSNTGSANCVVLAMSGATGHG